VFAWLLGVLLLAPALTRPVIAFGLVFGVVAFGLAWKSIAYPMGLAAIPDLLNAVLGSNPLPKGGTTFLFAAWIGLAVLLIVLRRQEAIGVRALVSVPVAMAVLLLALMLLRLGPSAAQSYGSHKIQLYVADNIVFLAGAVFVGAGRRHLRLFLLLTLATAVAGGAYLIFQLLSGHALQQYSGRFTLGAQEGAINLGRASATGVLIATYLILSAKRQAARLWAAAALPVLLISLIAAGSRGPVVAFVVGFITLLALTAVNRRDRRRLTGAAVVLLLAAIVVPLVVPGSAIGRALSTIVGSASGLSSNGRSSLWAQAYATFGLHPFVGLGTGGFAALNPEQYPHNILLEVAVELGAIGLVALLVMIGGMLARLGSLWRSTGGTERLQVALIIALFTSALVNACVSGAIQDNRDVWIWGGIGLGMFVRRQVVRERELGPPLWRVALPAQ
jgi:O-antigen ligase